MRILIIGAVAAGTSAAAKARRNNDQAEIVIYEKGYDISYSGCGMPYYIGGEIESIDELTPRDEAFFMKKYNVEVKTGHEVLAIDSKEKKVIVKDLKGVSEFEDTYDKLIIATGATAFVPPIPGKDHDHVFTLRNIENAKAIRDFIVNKNPKKALVAGTGFIGFEVVENLVNMGIEVTVVEMMDKITPNLDDDMAKYLLSKLSGKPMSIMTSTVVEEITERGVKLSSGEIIESDMVILATGVRPNVSLGKEAGIEIGVTGAIKVDDKMQTNLDDIYACGDCVETFNLITGKPAYHPLGSTANKTGRIAGDVATGGKISYKGNLGTGIFKLFDYAIATTGLSHKKACEEGLDVIVSHNIKPDKPSYFNGTEMVIKTIADVHTGKILGVQIVGQEGVDKRIDVFATLITYGATVDELFHIDLAYAPPFSTTKDPVHYSGMILDNALNNGRPIITADEVQARIDAGDDIQVIDARINKQYDAHHVDRAQNMPHASLREQLKDLDPKKVTVTYCNKGVTGNAAQNILKNNGFEDVKNLSGGHKFYKATKK